MNSPHLVPNFARSDEVTRFVADVMVCLGWVLAAPFAGSGAAQSLHWLILVLFTTARLRVLLSFVHRPMQVAGHRVHLLETTVGRFTSIRQPTIFDRYGEVMGLTTEISIGSIVRVHGEDRTMRAIQIVHLEMINPFQDT